MPHPIFRATITKGQLRIHDRERFDRYKLRLSGDVDVLVKPHRRIRSGNQNAWYWGVVLAIIADHTGHTSAEMHEFLKLKFNSKPITVNGEMKLIGSTTTDKNTSEFSEYIEQVRAWAAIELGLTIPDPTHATHSFTAPETSSDTPPHDPLRP